MAAPDLQRPRALKEFALRLRHLAGELETVAGILRRSGVRRCGGAILLCENLAVVLRVTAGDIETGRV